MGKCLRNGGNGNVNFLLRCAENHTRDGSRLLQCISSRFNCSISRSSDAGSHQVTGAGSGSAMRGPGLTDPATGRLPFGPRSRMAFLAKCWATRGRALKSDARHQKDRERDLAPRTSPERDVWMRAPWGRGEGNTEAVVRCGSHDRRARPRQGRQGSPLR